MRPWKNRLLSPSRWTTRNLARAIVVVGGLLVLLSGLFAGYYYWDRFRPRGQPSPMEVALQEAEQAVREDPADPDRRIHLAALYYENRLYPQALEEAEQVLRVYPDNEAALLLAGMAHIQLEHLEEALSPLERFIALRKARPGAKGDLQLEMAYYLVGYAHVALGQSEQAIEPLQAALAISPTDADALYQLGLAYQSTGKCAKALQAWEQAVRLVPDFGEAYQAMSVCYRALDQPDRALYAEGMVDFSAKRYRAAKDKLTQVVERLPEYAPAWLGLGLACEKLGDLEAARQALTRARQLAPQDLAIQHAYGRVEAALEALQSQEKSP